MESHGADPSPAPVPLAVFPRHDPLGLIAGGLAVTAVVWGLFLALSLFLVQRFHLGALLGFVQLPLSAMGLFIARWFWQRRQDRIEVFPDHITEWLGGQPQETALSRLSRVRLDLRAGEHGMSPYNTGTLRLETADGAAITLPERPLRALYPVMDVVSQPVVDRTFTAMARGETLMFTDTPVFPWKAAMGVLTALCFALCFLAVALVVGGEGPDAPGFVLMALLFPVPAAVGMYLKSLRPALQRWRCARRTGGVAVSARGIRPALDKTLATLAARSSDPFRGPSGEASGWIPWSTVRLARLTGHGIVLDLDSRPDATLLSAATDNLIPLWHVVRRQCPPWTPAPTEEAPVPPTGVRVDVSSDPVHAASTPADDTADDRVDPGLAPRSRSLPR